MSHTSNSQSQERPTRTLAQVLDALPYRAQGSNPVLKLDPLPNDTLPALEIPGFVDEPGPCPRPGRVGVRGDEVVPKRAERKVDPVDD